MFQKANDYFKVLVKNPTVKHLLLWALLLVICSVIFYIRYPYTYIYSNFYAEDGNILVKNILEEGPIKGALTLFNGYLVLGQYMLTEIAVVVNAVFGQGFETLAKAIAVVSYAFWGLVVTLPFLLFRRQLGTLLALLLVALLTIVPIGGYDYAVIGTIGNLKFAFFFIAALLVIYRNQLSKETKKWRFIIIDSILLLCALTNIITVVLLPFLLLRYKDILTGIFKNFKKTIKSLKVEHYSLIALALLSMIYAVAVYARGIPEMKGYLDEPLWPAALLDILYRGSVYGLTFSVNNFMHDATALLLIGLFSLLAIYSRYRVILLFIAFAIIVNVLGFALNRPGITHLFEVYTTDGGPGLFFYAGTLLFVFGFVYALKDWFRRQAKKSKVVLSVLVVAFCIIVLPASNVGKVSYDSITSKRPTLAAEVDRVCDATTQNANKVEIGIYPAVNWTLTLPRQQVCDTP